MKKRIESAGCDLEDLPIWVGGPRRIFGKAIIPERQSVTGNARVYETYWVTKYEPVEGDA